MTSLYSFKNKRMWRFDILNHLIKKFGYRRYLEIGVEDGDCFRRINCQHKDGVDPGSEHATHVLPSDIFFAQLDPNTKYDLIFIDGLHIDEQVRKDIANSLKCLAPNGTIVMHDCNPPTEWHQRSYHEANKNGFRQWNGTVWKAYIHFRTCSPDLSMCVVDTDWGCGIIRKGHQKVLDITDDQITYTGLDANRHSWLNLISTEQFINSI